MSTSTSRDYVSATLNFAGGPALNSVDSAKYKFYKAAIYNGQVSPRFTSFWESEASNFLFQKYLEADASAEGLASLKIASDKPAYYSGVSGLWVKTLTGTRYRSEYLGSIRDLFTVSAPCVVVPGGVNLNSMDTSPCPSEVSLWAIPAFATDFTFPDTHMLTYLERVGDVVGWNVSAVGTDISSEEQSVAESMRSLVKGTCVRMTANGLKGTSPSKVRRELFTKHPELLHSLADYFCKKICTPHPETYVYGAVYRKDLTLASLAAGNPTIVLDMLVTTFAGLPRQTPASFSAQGVPSGYSYVARNLNLGTLTGQKPYGFVRANIKIGMFREDHSEAVWEAAGGFAKVVANALKPSGIVINEDGINVDLGERFGGLANVASDQGMFRTYSGYPLFPGEDSSQRQTLSFAEMCSRFYLSAGQQVAFAGGLGILTGKDWGVTTLSSGAAGLPIVEDPAFAGSDIPEEVKRAVGEVKARLGDLTAPSISSTLRTAMVSQAHAATRIKAIKTALYAVFNASNYFRPLKDKIKTAREKATMEAIYVHPLIPANKVDEFRARYLSDEVFRKALLKTNDHSLHMFLIRQGFIPLPDKALQAA